MASLHHILVYNGADTIPELADRLSRVCPTLFSNYEIIFIDDGSPDPSWATIQRLAATVPNVVGVRLRRNFGQHNATLCGIRAARFPITITMDDDLQHPPEQLPALLDEFRKGYDVVYAVPKKLPHAWWRNLGSRMIKLILSKIMNIPIQDIGAFRIFRTELRDAFADYHSPDVYIDPLLSWGTTSFSHIAVEEKPRTVGESNYTMKSLIRATLSIMTGYSTIPLRLASILGFFFLKDKNSCTVHSVVFNLSKKTMMWIPNEHYNDEKYLFKFSFNSNSNPAGVAHDPQAAI